MTRGPGERRQRNVRVADEVWEAAQRTLDSLRDPLHVAVRIAPGMTMSDVMREVLRVVAEDVLPAPMLVTPQPPARAGSSGSRVPAASART